MGLETIAGLLLTAAGTAYGVKSSADAQSQMNKDTAAVVGQEQALQRQATPIYQQNLKQVTSNQPAQQGIAQALQEYNKVGAAPVSTQPVVAETPSKAVDLRTAADIARSKQASANVAQYGAQQTGWNVGNINTNAKLGNISQIGQSAASTLPANLSLAQAQGAIGNSIGNAVSSVGNLAGVYGQTKKSQSTNQQLLDAINGYGATAGGQF